MNVDHAETGICTADFHEGWRRLFSLVELLVVVAIIGILAALLMPSLRTALTTARSAACINNERQVGIIFSSYETENSDKVIPFRLNYGKTIEYISLLTDSDYLHVTSTNASASGSKDFTVFRCPEGIDLRGYGSITDRYDENGKYFWRATSPVTGLVADSHYAINASTSVKYYPCLRVPLDTGSTVLVTLSSLPKPSRLVRMLDGFWGNYQSQPQRLNARHSNGQTTNVLKFDGSGRSAPIALIPDSFSSKSYLTSKFPEFIWRLDQ